MGLGARAFLTEAFFLGVTLAFLVELLADLDGASCFLLFLDLGAFTSAALSAEAWAGLFLPASFWGSPSFDFSALAFFFSKAAAALSSFLA